MHSCRGLRAAGNLTRALVSIALGCGLVWGQANVGEISGQVSDATGSAVPNCAVTATHTQTGLKRSVKTHDNGVFVLAGLPEGTYGATGAIPAREQSLVSGNANQAERPPHLPVWGGAAAPVCYAASERQQSGFN